MKAKNALIGTRVEIKRNTDTYRLSRVGNHYNTGMITDRCNPTTVKVTFDCECVRSVPFKDLRRA